MTRILIDPACNFYYSSFFIKGLFEKYGCKVKFSSKPFVSLFYTKHTHILAFVKIEGKTKTNYVIDFADAPTIENEFLDWCDVYGKINYRDGLGYSNKIVHCAPNCALKIWSKPVSGVISLLNYAKCYKRTVDFKSYLSWYLMTSKRRKDFNNTTSSDSNYIFLVGTLWQGQDKTNLQRINFIRACKQLDYIHYEGGLLPDSKNVDEQNNDVLLISSLGYENYISKTNASAVVFNTPAFHLCHGWKLTEFLAMGKAIISTPFSNELPVPLVHGENIFFVSEDADEIKKAIVELTTNNDLRTKIEKGAIDYYKKYVEPREAIKHLMTLILENDYKSH